MQGGRSRESGCASLFGSNVLPWLWNGLIAIPYQIKINKNHKHFLYKDDIYD
jgi:hypothetical protein